MKKVTGSQFAADFGSVKLPKEVERDVAVGIQRLVLDALARVDFRGDLTTKPPERLLAEIGGQTQGIWVEARLQ